MVYVWTLLSRAGIGGNLVAIQSSRFSTHLHFHCAPGEVPEEAKGCYYPCRTFFGTGQCECSQHYDVNQQLEAVASALLVVSCSARRVIAVPGEKQLLVPSLE